MEDDDDSFLVAVLWAACFVFCLVLLLSILAYCYLRIRVGRQLQRLPTDHHEMALQGPIVETNGGYQPDDFTRGNFEQKLSQLLDDIDANKHFPRNDLQLEINNVIGTGNFGDVIKGHLKGDPSQVHVISGELVQSWLKDFN